MGTLLPDHFASALRENARRRRLPMIRAGRVHGFVLNISDFCSSRPKISALGRPSFQRWPSLRSVRASARCHNFGVTQHFAVLRVQRDVTNDFAWVGNLGQSLSKISNESLGAVCKKAAETGLDLSLLRVLIDVVQREHGQFTDTPHQNAARASGACAGSPLLSITQLVAGVCNAPNPPVLSCLSALS